MSNKSIQIFAQNLYADKNVAAITKLLPPRADPDVFLTSTWQALKGIEKLHLCDPVSVMHSIVNVAQMGLIPGIRQEVALIPYWNKQSKMYDLNVVPMWRGLMKIATSNPAVSNFNRDLVYNGEAFKCMSGSNPSIHHEQNADLRSSSESIYEDVAAAYACCTVSGSLKYYVAYRPEILRAREASQKKDLWDKWPEPFFLKVPVKRLCKMIPEFGPDMAHAIHADDNNESGIYIPSEPPEGTDLSISCATKRVSLSRKLIEKPGAVETRTTKENMEDEYAESEDIRKEKDRQEAIETEEGDDRDERDGSDRNRGSIPDGGIEGELSEGGGDLEWLEEPREGSGESGKPRINTRGAKNKQA